MLMCDACGEGHEALDNLRRCEACAAREERLDLHPMQQIRWDGKDVIRYRKNAIVAQLLRTHPAMDLNTIALGGFTQEDRVQLTQLIGYSVLGSGELSHMPVSVVYEADRLAEQLTEGKGR